MSTTIDIDISEKVLSLCLEEIGLFVKDDEIRLQLEKALYKTLGHIKGGKVSPAIYPVLVANDLNHINLSLAYDLSVICAFFHTYADLTDDIEDQETNNDVINSVGQPQAINLTNMLLFIAHHLIGLLQIENKNKINLFNLFSSSGIKMVSGQFFDIATTNTNLKNDFKLVAEKKAGAEFACFLSAFPMAIGENNKPFYNLGIYYGALSQVFSDYFDIWGKPFSQDLFTLKKSLPILAATQDRDFLEKVRLILAGKNDLADKQLDLRRIISLTQAVENFENYVLESKTEIEKILKSLVNLKVISKMIRELLNNCQIMASSLKELRKIARNDYYSHQLNLDKNIKIALEHLTSVKHFQDSWEIQRSGFLDEEELVADLFPVSFILETLFEAGMDISEELEYFLVSKKNDGWHRYKNAPGKNPPDADLLGQVLNLAGKTKIIKSLDYFQKPLKLLEENLDERGNCPTWLCDNQIFKKEYINKNLYGNKCPGVMANLYYGLHLFDKNKYGYRISRGINNIINLFDHSENTWQSKFYSEKYTFYLVARLINSQPLSFKSLDLSREALIAVQKLNGSWDNSPQNTAFVLLGLLTFPEIYPLIIKTGLKYLQETQDFDGSWTEEDFYLCPGANGRFSRFKNSKVTTAFCLRAMLRAKALLDKLPQEQT